MSEIVFTKSTRSASNGACVEVAFTDDGYIHVRDSKDPSGPVLKFTSAEWDAFVAGAKDGEFDLGWRGEAVTPAEEIRAAVQKIREALDDRVRCWMDYTFNAGVAALIADLLDAHVVWWERLQEQNSRPGDGRTRVLPNDNEVKALELARAINGVSDDGRVMEP